MLPGDEDIIWIIGVIVGCLLIVHVVLGRRDNCVAMKIDEKDKVLTRSNTM